MEEAGLPEWTTDMDRDILVWMSNGYLHTPTTLADRTDRMPESISRRLNSLSAGGLVKKEGRGQYRITDKGLKLWKQSRKPVEIPDSNEMEPVSDERSKEEIIESAKKDYELDMQCREEYGIGIDEFRKLWSQERTRLLENGHVDSPETEELATENVEKRLRENSNE